MNKALKLSCIKGMPVRVVRSYKVWGGSCRLSNLLICTGCSSTLGGFSQGLNHAFGCPRISLCLQEKRSAYAPTDQTPVRYDGVYRILRCWRKPGNQHHLICR